MRARARTLRGRVSAVGIVVVGGWLLLLTVVINALLAQRLARDIDGQLRTRAGAVAATVNVTGTGTVHVSEPAADDALDSGIWIFVGTRPVEQPPGHNGLGPLARRMAAGPGGFTTSQGGFRLYARPVTASGRRVATVIVALSTSPSHRSRDEALIGSIVLALLALVGAYFALRWTAARALQPVDRMTHKAGEWSATQLGERFDTHQQFAELDELAATLNGVLDRQAAAVRHERQLLAELSHELRTPLSRIVAESDLLLARPHDTAATNTAHARIRETALAMNKIIETLLAAGRADALAATGSCQLGEAVDATLRHRAASTSGGPRPTVRVDVPPLAVGVESALLERIIAPLLDNAERFARTRVDVSAQHEEGWIELVVADDGAGVEPEAADRIFSPGFQAGHARRSGGAGLGLPLARRLARAAGGDVTFAGGSTFHVRLPPA